MKVYRTVQGERLLEFLRENRDRSYTAEEITNALCGDGIGKSTVYRRITKLIESGEVKRFESRDNRGFKYQYAGMNDSCEEHFHLRCTSCEKLVHLECGELSELRTHVRSEHGFLIGGSAIINGLCSECAGGVLGDNKSRK